MFSPIYCVVQMHILVLVTFLLCLIHTENILLHIISSQPIKSTTGIFLLFHQKMAAFQIVRRTITTLKNCPQMSCSRGICGIYLLIRRSVQVLILELKISREAFVKR